MTSAQAFGPLLLDIRQDFLNAMFGRRDDKVQLDKNCQVSIMIACG